MRIIAGIAKGRIIKAPKGLQTRPTTDRVREAIFSTIAANLENANVLDLYAGSGALGLEALSRGADKATFVDLAHDSTKLIDENAKKIGFIEDVKILRKNVESFLKSVGEKQYDLIFMDAPYRISLTELVNIINLAKKVLTEKGVLVVEHSKNTHINEAINIQKEKSYGQTIISYLQGS